MNISIAACCQDGSSLLCFTLADIVIHQINEIFNNFGVQYFTLMKRDDKPFRAFLVYFMTPFISYFLYSESLL